MIGFNLGPTPGRKWTRAPHLAHLADLGEQKLRPAREMQLLVNFSSSMGRRRPMCERSAGRPRIGLKLIGQLPVGR